MAQVRVATLIPFPSSERRSVLLVSIAHAFSHCYMLVLPPIFPLLHADTGLSYTVLGTLLAVYALATGLMQFPVGLLVDRLGARRILAFGLALNGLAILLLGLAPGYWTLLLLMATAGAANAVFHPADYTILSSAVAEERMGRAFSMHLVAGYLGWMIAPLAVLGLSRVGGWPFALAVLGGVGVIYGLWLLTQAHWLPEADHRAGRGGAAHSGRQRLLTPVILALLAFYFLIALGGNGIKSFSVVALGQLHGLGLDAANLALAAYLAFAALGTLFGGWVADGVRRPERATGIAFTAAAAVVAVLAVAGLPSWMVLVCLSLAGFLVALVAPLRDVMVRQAAPVGAIGTTFGLVTTGFSAGFVISPLLLGWLLDHGHPEALFWFVALTSLLAVLTVGGVGVVRRAPAPEPSPR